MTANQSSDSIRVRQWYDNAHRILNENTVQADSLIHLGLQLSLKNRDSITIMEGYFLQGCLFDRKALNKEAIYQLEKASSFFERHHLTRHLLECYGRLGLLYSKVSEQNKGLASLLKALKLADYLDQPAEKIRLLNLLAMHHNDYTMKYDRAIEYLKEAEVLSKSIGDDSKIGHLYLQYSISYRYKKQFKKALLYAKKCAREFKKIDSDFNLLRAYLTEAGVYDDLQDPVKLANVLQLAAPLLTKANSHQMTGNYELFLARVAYLQNNYTTAMEHAQQAYHEMFLSGDLQNLAWVNTLLFQLHYLMGHRKQGDSLYLASIQAKDSIYAEQVLKNDATMRAQYEHDKKEQLLVLKEKDLNYITQQRVVLIGFLLLLSTLGVINYKRYREKRRHAIELGLKNKKIDRQYNLLKQTNEQNELLLREIHHRVKNNLQLAASLLNMQIRTTDNQEAVNALRESANRLYSMLLVHQELYGRDRLAAISLPTYTRNLVDYLLQSYHASTYEMIPTVDVCEHISLKTDSAIPLGLMMTELITNSLKYSKPQQGNTLYIWLIVHHLKENEYELIYRDNGEGLPTDIHLTTSNTMGMRLLRDLTRQLNGTFKHPYQGQLSFHVTFKDL